MSKRCLKKCKVNDIIHIKDGRSYIVTEDYVEGDRPHTNGSFPYYGYINLDSIDYKWPTYLLVGDEEIAVRIIKSNK